MNQCLDALQSVTVDMERYAQSPSDDLYQAIGQRIASVVGTKRVLVAHEQTELEKIMAQSVKTEPVWGLLAALCLWSSGCRQIHDFLNVWNLARYAGIQSRFSRVSPQVHLENNKTMYRQASREAVCIMEGNALRQLHRYAEAESAYLQGLAIAPENPFLKLRLVDLWLMTYQHARAMQMLASLRSRYPYALEMLFALPVPEDVQGPDNQLPPLDPQGARCLWLVAADPVYLERYGVRFAQTVASAIAKQVPPVGLKLHVHVHVLKDTDCPAPIATLQAMADLVPLHITQRMLDLSGVSPEQRAALFSCERFLFLAEMLAKYNCPMLVTDIDIDCLKDPSPVFTLMGEADIAYTRFATIRDAWDLYPATALFAKPTAAAITFFKRLSGMLLFLLQNHPRPWFADQVALFRLIEGGLTPATFAYCENLLTDANLPEAYFRILHGSWDGK